MYVNDQGIISSSNSKVQNHNFKNNKYNRGSNSRGVKRPDSNPRNQYVQQDQFSPTKMFN